MELSIVTTLYYSSRYLQEFYRRISESALRITVDYEIIFVNDGSPDDSLDTVVSFQKRDRHVKVVDLSKNFGHHKAAMTGLSFATGRKIFLINCDLEESPEDLLTFNNVMSSNLDCDVVYGINKRRKGNFIRRSIGNLFYMILNRLAKTRFENGMTFSRLMTRRFVKSLLSFRENELFIVGLWHLTGYKQIPVEIETRYKGISSYTFQKKIDLAINAITSFSNKPLVYISYLGILISFISGSFIVYLVAAKLFFAAPLLGWTSLIVSIWFVGGLMLLSLGVIGMYLSKIFIETKHRPYSIVKDTYPSAMLSQSSNVDQSLSNSRKIE